MRRIVSKVTKTKVAGQFLESKIQSDKTLKTCRKQAKDALAKKRKEMLVDHFSRIIVDAPQLIITHGNLQLACPNKKKKEKVDKYFLIGFWIERVNYNVLL